MRRVRKIFSLLLAAAFLLVQAAFTAPPVRAEDTATYTYSPVRQKYAIAPAALYTNQDFYNGYVKTDAIWAFNSIWYFTGHEVNYNTEKVSYTRTFTQTLSSFDPVLEMLRQKGQLLVNFRVSLANSNSGVGVAKAEVKYYRDFGQFQTDSNYRVYGNMDYFKYAGTTMNLSYWKDGVDGTKVIDSSLVFADATAPSIQQIYSSAALDGPATNLFDKNSTAVYIHVKFNEYIRFSDNNATSHNDILLKLKIGRIGGSTVDNADQTAKLVRLKGDTLTFKYDIPDKIKGEDLNHSITGFDGIFENGKKILDASGGNYYPLRVLTYTGELTGHYNATGLVTYSSKSLVTDLAGNPCASATLPDPWKEIFIDETPPVVDRISLAVSGSKSQYVGPGSRVTPSVTFSEPLYWYNNAIYQKYSTIATVSHLFFYATLNVKYSSGGNVSVQGATFDDSSGKLTFQGFTITEGMTLEAGADRILVKSIEVKSGSYPPMDARGNLLGDRRGNSQYIDDIPAGLTADQFILDAGKPQVSTSIQPAGGKYKPEAYDSDNDGKEDSFRFPFSISDALSGVMPAGDGGPLEGSFKWELADAGVDTSQLSFRYAVTSSADTPAQWNGGGKFGGTGYTFVQYPTGYAWLHIKVEGLEGVDLDASKLSITGSDLMSNKDTGTYTLDGTGLNSILDHTPPEITANKLQTYKDASDGDKWKFAAQFTLKDIGTIDAASMEYQWTEKDKGPDGSQWQVLAGFGGDAQTIVADAVYTLADNAFNACDLYIRAADCSSNANMAQSGPYAFVRDLRAPGYEAEVDSGLTKKARLRIKAEAQTAFYDPDTVPAKILVLVEEGSGAYSAAEIDAGVSAVDIANVFAAGAVSWVSTGSVANGLVAGTYYGEARVKVVAGYGISYDTGSRTIQNPKDSTLSEESYTLYTAPSSGEIHSVNITPSFSVVNGGGWNSPDDGPKYFTTMDGAGFTVDVENTAAPGWGAKDFDSEKSCFALYKVGNSTPVYTAPIGMNTTITLPAGLGLETGSYYAEAVVTAKTSGREDRSPRFEFMIDTTQPEDFGLSKTETLWTSADPGVNALFGRIGANAVYHGYDRMDNNAVEAYSSAPTVLMGSGENGAADAARKLYFTTLSDNDEFFIKVWNATTSAGINEADGKAAAEWQPISGTSTGGFTALVMDSAADVLAAYGPGRIPVINNTDNILRYQICHANGIKSAEKVLLVNVSDETPELEVERTPEDMPSTEVTATITRLSSATDLEMQAYYWNGDSGTVPEAVYGEKQLLQEDNNWFYTCNVYGNYAFLNVQAANLDIAAPVLNVLQQGAGEGQGYAISVLVEDKSPWELFMKFDGSYMGRLGMDGSFPLEVPATDGGVWTADAASPSGIYKIARDDLEVGSTGLTIFGVYLYDEGKPGIVSLPYTLYARDAAGNESSLLSGTLSDVSNVRPEVELTVGNVREDVSYYYNYGNGTIMDVPRSMMLYDVSAGFNLPVRNVTPLQHHRAENGYSLRKDFLSIFKDGTYTITYDDIFGNSYQVDKDVVVDGIYTDMNIDLSAVDADGKYTVSVEPVANVGRGFMYGNEGPRFTLFADKYDGSFTYADGYVKYLTAVRTDNPVQYDQDQNAIIAMMEYRDGWHLSSYNNIPIILIDGATRKVPAADVHWYYHEFASGDVPAGESETDDRVDVWLTAGEPITALDGGLLSHTFVYGEASSHTFRYTTSDGRIGVTTVSLPVDIVESKPDTGRDNYNHDNGTGTGMTEEDLIIPDITAPTALFNVYGNFGSIARNKGTWYTESGGGIGPLLTWAGAFTLRVEIIDESKTKMILLKGEDASDAGITYETARSDVIDGVVLSGTNIKVTKPVAFTVLLIDEAGNRKKVSFPENLWEQLDIIAPSLGSLDYEKTGFLTVDAKFTLTDDKTPGSQVELISPTGLSFDVATGVYTLTFTENKGVEIAIRDLAGNVGSDTISVTGIDDQPPAAEVVWWSKGLYDSAAGIYDPTLLTTEKTNQTITAKLNLNKPVKSVAIDQVEVEDANGEYIDVPSGQWGDYVALDNGTDSIFADFLENAKITVAFTALNNKTGSITLTVSGIIDKADPLVTVDKADLVTATTATVTFRDFSEPVYVYGPGETGKLFSPGETLTKTFTGRGTYIFRFTDEAGNTKTEYVEIKNIDINPPGILLSDMPQAGRYFSTPITFKATMSEEGTLTWNGVAKGVLAPDDLHGNNDGVFDDNECDWVTFTADKNGSYPIVAEDIAGRRTTAYVEISCFDNAAPSISFSPLTVTALSSTDMESLNTMLDQGVTVKDNATAPGDILLSHEPFIAAHLNSPGLYQILYTAEDLAGNISTAVRYVKVYSATEINVTVNGKRTEAKGAVVLSELQVTLEVSKLPLGDHEPYKVYLRKGVWTAGQMKGIQPLASPAGFTVPDKGYYTLYIVTQNRGTYLTYLYIE